METIRYFDAHNHFQDTRLDPWRESIASECERQLVSGMVVNGTHEGDWPAVAELARRFSWVIPSFGYHPWYLERATSRWKDTLQRYLDEFPFAVGEIGIDRWMKNPDVTRQEEMFLEQLELARVRELPASIHCIKAWGRLHELLSSVSLPDRGFLLHSYSGSVELIEPFVRLGAYCSCAGYFLAPRKLRQLETFRQLPIERLLIETDAPDQLLPEELDRFSLESKDGQRLNHPVNIVATYQGVAEVLGRELSECSTQVALNFQRLFGPR